MSRIYYPQCRAILQVVFDGFGPTAKDTPPKIIPVLPKEATIHRNSYKQADSWELVFDADDFPIDPQLVRSGAAEIYLFGTDGIREDQRVLGRQSTSSGHAGRDAVVGVLESVGAVNSKDLFTLGNDPIIAGLWDDHSVEYSSSGRWCSISGQDYTALLIGKQWPPTAKGLARRIPTGKRLDLLLKEILAEADETGRLSVLVEGVDASSLPIVGRNESRTNKRGIPIESETSYWDVMYGLAIRYGMILFVRGLDVVLTRPKNLTDADEHRVRHMVWGRNLESLEMKRHLGKEKVPHIVVRAYTGKGDTLTVEFPNDGSYSGAKKLFKPNAKHNDRTTVKFRSEPKKPRKSKAKTVNIRNTDEYQIIPVFGISDEVVLRNMAENFYNLLGRAERTVRFTTRDLTGVKDRNLLDLAAGDAVSISFEEYNIDRALLANGAVDEKVKYQHLIDRGYGDSVASVISEKYIELQSLQRPLRVREVSYEYSASSGISIEAELIDFVVVDGAREPGHKEPRKDQRKARKADGSPVGGPREKADSLIQQHGRP